MNENDFKNLLEYGKRKSIIDGQEIIITKLPFCFIKWQFSEFIEQGEMNKAVIKALKKLKIKHKALTSNDIVSIFLYLYDEICTKDGIIYRLEETYLSSTPDVNMIAAGQNKLSPFNNLMTLFNLANRNILLIEEVSKLPYQMLLDIQTMNKLENEIKENYQNIILKKK